MPMSFLDVGLGNGKMGFIARDLLDVMLGGRYLKKDWEVKIDGIEIFPDYIQGHQRFIYDTIYIGDAFTVVDTLDTYDVIYLGDSLEHFTKEQGWQLLDKCAEHSKRYIIVSLPLGEKWTQPAIYGNPYEEHKSFWKLEEFEPFAQEHQLLDFTVGPYGTFLIKREDYMHHRIREKSEAFFLKGDKDTAIKELMKSLTKLPPNIISEYTLVDFFLQEKNVTKARERLEKISTLFPEDQSVKDYLKQLQNKI